MKLLYYLTDLFVDVFGITRPDAKARHRAAIFIMSLMLLTLIVVACAAWLLRSMMH